VRKLLLSLFGAPGSGKGTLARACKERLGLTNLSTGELCRRYVAQKTEIGKQIIKITESGGLVPDELMVTIVTTWFEEVWLHAQGVLLDGFPRTKGQVIAFMNFLKNRGLEHYLSVVVLNVAHETLIERLASRLVCSNKNCQEIYSRIIRLPRRENLCDTCGSAVLRRVDDEEDAVKERLKIYDQHRETLLRTYRLLGCHVATIEVGRQTVEQVFEEFKKSVWL